MDPDWLSVNLGILVCIECSGPHRSLGVNFSKIQSLTLDKMGTASLLIARKMGNELFNEAYEGRDPGIEKPLPESSVEAKRNFIRSKYVDKAYVVNTGHGIELIKDLAMAIQNADWCSIVQAYAEGARPDGIVDLKSRKSCLHLSVEINPSLHILEFLLQNSPEVNHESTGSANATGPIDSDGNTILHKALQKDLNLDYIKLISRKYPKAVHHKNNLNKTPQPLTRKEAVIEVMMQAAENRLPKQLHVDFNWDLNINPNENHSDDDLIDESSILNESYFSNKAKRNSSTNNYFEEPSTDPNILDKSSSSLIDNTTSSSRPVRERLSSSSIKYSSRPSNAQVQMTPNIIAEMKHVKLRPTNKSRQSPTQMSHTPKDDSSKIHMTHSNESSKMTHSHINQNSPNYPVTSQQLSGFVSVETSKERVVPPDNFTVRDTNRLKPALRSTPPGHVTPGRPASGNYSKIETPKPLPRTIPSSALQVQNEKKTIIHSENELLEFVERPQTENKRNSTPGGAVLLANTKNIPTRSASFNAENVANAAGKFTQIENDYSTPLLPPETKQRPAETDIEELVSRKGELPRRVEAQYDCDGDEDDELSFVAGEIITVTDKEDDDWWVGHIESQPHRKGCFPVIFVKPLDSRSKKK
jgi:Arf-GAP/SH3 domain/ANK repeat/PH domain-containing protein